MVSTALLLLAAFNSLPLQKAHSHLLIFFVMQQTNVTITQNTALCLFSFLFAFFIYFTPWTNPGPMQQPSFPYLNNLQIKVSSSFLVVNEQETTFAKLIGSEWDMSLALRHAGSVDKILNHDNV